jgi:hypothetical protein
MTFLINFVIDSWGWTIVFAYITLEAFVSQTKHANTMTKGASRTLSLTMSVALILGAGSRVGKVCNFITPSLTGPLLAYRL